MSARPEAVPLRERGAYVVIIRGVCPSSVDPQPGDRSLDSAKERAIPLVDSVKRGDVAPPLLRQRARGRYEIWDGNARVTAFAQEGRPFDAILVGETGEIARRTNGETVPLEPEVWDELVAEVRGLVDQGRVDFAWPSPGAHDWITREYLARGGRFGRQRTLRPRTKRGQRSELRTYSRLFGEADTAPDLYALADIVTQGRELQSPTLRGALTRKALERARWMGLSCARADEACVAQLLRYAGTRQGSLFNPRRLKRRLT